MVLDCVTIHKLNDWEYLMTMHLLGPAYTTTGKKKGKAKFRNSEAARKAKANKDSWNALLEKWNVEKQKTSKTTQSSLVVRRNGVLRPGSDTKHLASLDSGNGSCVKPKEKIYTGDAMIGISVLHKSNGVPVFRQDDIIDINKMRR